MPFGPELDDPRRCGSANEPPGRPARRPRAARPPRGEGIRGRVLIVEDDFLEALSLQLVLTGARYSVVGHVAAGREALAGAIAHKPDLVLVDVSLRGAMDGIDAARRIGPMAGSRVLFVTAHADPATVARMRAVHPAGILTKPFTARELLVAVEAALTAQ